MHRLLAALFSSLLLATSISAAEYGLEKGKLFPDFTLPTLAGGEHRSIGSFRGKRVVLHVFASW